MKKSLLIILFTICFVPLMQGQTADIYQKYFPDPTTNMPLPITKGDPVFNYFTKYKDVISFIQELAAKHSDIMSVSSIGTTQKGKNQPMVLLTRKSNIADQDKLRVTFIGGIHGNEPLSTDGMLYLMYLVVNDASNTALLDKVILEVIPMVNADGRTAETRVSNNTTDLNRDLTILNAKESTNLKLAINKFDPHVVVDFHEFSPARMDFKELNDCYTSAYDILFLYTGNLNVDPGIRDMIKNVFVEPTKSVLMDHGRRVSDYCTTFMKDNEVWLNIGGIASRSSATNYALQNRISMLMEIRGLSEKEKSAKRRIETSAITALSYLKIAHDHEAEIKEVVKTANKSAVEATRPSVSTSKPDVMQRDYKFVDKCKVSDTTIVFNANYNIKQTPLIERPKPGAFLIFPASEKTKKVLEVSGISVKTTTQPFQLNNTEQYAVNENGQINIVKEAVSIPEGALVIDSQQAMSNVIADLIEPDGANSLYTNKIIRKKSKESRIPIYRISREQLSQLSTK
ncbi:M14 family zinc carboxypeptidase [Flavobacterium mesophilum]|uniref:M14 family zinc carboxypeptidase n=1 Tax=Flavobacterium mesophilum TaxID=3143495 RepID=UPI0031DDD412